MSGRGLPISYIKLIKREANKNETNEKEKRDANREIKAKSECYRPSSNEDGRNGNRKPRTTILVSLRRQRGVYSPPIVFGILRREMFIQGHKPEIRRDFSRDYWSVSHAVRHERMTKRLTTVDVRLTAVAIERRRVCLGGGCMRRSTNRGSARRRTLRLRVVSPTIAAIHRFDGWVATNGRVSELGLVRTEPVRVDRG